MCHSIENNILTDLLPFKKILFFNLTVIFFNLTFFTDWSEETRTYFIAFLLQVLVINSHSTWLPWFSGSLPLLCHASVRWPGLYQIDISRPCWLIVTSLENNVQRKCGTFGITASFSTALWPCLWVCRLCELLFIVLYRPHDLRTRMRARHLIQKWFAKLVLTEYLWLLLLCVCAGQLYVHWWSEFYMMDRIQ